MSPLYARLHLWAVTPHEWGYSDCHMAPADWVLDQCGRDPGADLRGTYGDPAVCPIARAYQRDPLPVVRKAYAGAGVPVTTAPVPGDVGIIRQNGNRFLIGALCLGESWATKTLEQGVLIIRPIEIVAAWEVGYAQ